MAQKKRSSQERLRLEVIRTYRARFNSARETAAAFGVSPKTMRDWLNKIVEGENPVSNDFWSETYLERRGQADKYFEGDKDMKLNYDRRGKNFHIQDYIIKPGERIPDNEVTRNAYGYQIIIKGKERGKSRKVTSSLAGLPSDAAAQIRKMMSEYSRFGGQVAYLRVFSPLEDIEEE